MISEQSDDITKEWKLYMYLLRCAIRGEKVNKEVFKQYEGIKCSKLVKRAKENGQSFLLNEVINEYVVYCGEEIKDTQNLQYTIYEYEKYKCIRNVIKQAKDNNIPFVIFKGCVLADLYPNYIQRSSCDTDIYVDKEYRQQSIDMLVNCGYVINEEKSKGEVCVLKYDKFPHVIELHTCLWEDYNGRRLDILESMQLTDKDRLIEVEACGMKVTTLGYEEHLIYQLFHIIKHFSLEGIGVKYLADITLFVNAYGKYIEYDQFWDKLEKLDYAKFSHYLFAICVEFLGMDDSILNNRHMVIGDELLELMFDLFNGGVMTGSKKDSWQILGIMTPYFTGEKKAGKNKFMRKMAVIFPRAKDLQDCYSYAKKLPILLPIAWVDRAIKFFKRYYSPISNSYSTGEKLDVAEHRISLMNKMGLLG